MRKESFNRRAVIALLLAASAQPLLTQAAQGDYPQRPIRLVVPFAAGGTSDVLARAVGAKLSEELGQPVVVDNRAGANGNIGSDQVAKAAPDGYTLLLAADGTMAINPSLYSKLSFQPERDFIAISRIAQVPLIVVAAPALQMNTLQDLISRSKADGANLDYSSAGVGSAGHLTGELLKAQTGARLTHVPYKGGGQAITDAISGQVPLMVTAYATAGPFIKTGKLKALAVTSAQRLQALPDVPTVAEAGVPRFDVSSWYGLMAPAKTPEPIINRLHAALSKVLKSPEMKARMDDLGAQAVVDNQGQFAQIIKTDTARWAQIVKSAHVSLDQ